MVLIGSKVCGNRMSNHWKTNMLQSIIKLKWYMMAKNTIYESLDYNFSFLFLFFFHTFHHFPSIVVVGFLRIIFVFIATTFPSFEQPNNQNEPVWNEQILSNISDCLNWYLPKSAIQRQHYHTDNNAHGYSSRQRIFHFFSAFAVAQCVLFQKWKFWMLPKDRGRRDPTISFTEPQ